MEANGMFADQAEIYLQPAVGLTVDLW